MRNLAALESAVAQPRMTFNGHDLYSSLESKAAAICFFIVQNHPFLDGNKRCGHAAMETLLVLNGTEIDAAVDDSERIILQVASGTLALEKLIDWVKVHIHPLTT